MKIVRQRAGHLNILWQEGLWKKGILGIWSLIGIFIFLRDDVLIPADDKQWKIINLIYSAPKPSPWVIASGILLTLLVWIFEASYRSSKKDKDRLAIYEAPSPIKIIFNPQNPQQRFWSIESVLKLDGTVSHNYIKYNVLVENTSARTIHNVQVVSEPTGTLVSRPGPGTFDLTKETITTLHPSESKLVSVLHWPHPPRQAGMLAGSSAREGYGGLKVTVSATDTPIRIHEFDFDYEREPMLFEPIQHMMSVGTGS